jgi:shikimate kinase
MKLLFLYGSPAVGKLTVAREIARRTDLKVFHNHLSIDCVKPVFEFGTKSFWRVVELIRFEIVAEAARAGQSLVYTFCYAKDKDDLHVERMLEVVEGAGGEVHFVLLKAERSEVEKRVLAESRREFNKANNLEILHQVWEQYDLFSPVNARESLIIDNTNLSPQAAAQQIIEHFNLMKKET